MTQQANQPAANQTNQEEKPPFMESALLAMRLCMAFLAVSLTEEKLSRAQYALIYPFATGAAANLLCIARAVGLHETLGGAVPVDPLAQPLLRRGLCAALAAALLLLCFNPAEEHLVVYVLLAAVIDLALPAVYDAAEEVSEVARRVAHSRR